MPQMYIKMPIQMIMALSRNDVIGVHNQLPWHIPFDLKWFKMNTYGGVCIMGRKTWDSLPGPLPGRISIVLSRQSRKSKDCIFCKSLPEALQIAQKHSNNIYVIGGSDIFTQILLLKVCNGIILTRVHNKIHEKRAIYATLPNYKQLTWKSRDFQHKKLTFHFEIYKLKYR